MKTLEIHIVRENEPHSAVIEATHAKTFFKRLRGLLGKAPLAYREGLLMSPCNQVHTIGMRYPLDVVYLDRDGRVVKCVENVKPFRFSAAKGARHTLELAAHTAKELGITPGEHLVWK